MSFLKYPDMVFLEGFSHMVLLKACCFTKQITVTVSVQPHSKLCGSPFKYCDTYILPLKFCKLCFMGSETSGIKKCLIQNNCVTELSQCTQHLAIQSLKHPQKSEF